MCGIIGAVGNIPNKEIFEKGRNVIRHRGPDDYGMFYDKKQEVALGHNRLSIIDLTKDGRQPMKSADGRFVMVYNGEIYNYLELKQELSDMYNFRTKTDSEVLLAAYIVWKEKCLDKLNGMFAFAIWDNLEKRIFCARDRLGEKPFFYAMSNNTFLFSSEIKGLLALGIKREPNERIIFEYLYYGLYDHRDETFFNGVKSLRPGHLLIFEDGKLIIRKYWSLKENKYDFKGITFNDAKERFRGLLADSIRLRFRSDVPVGLNLSSGVDSNSILFYARDVTGHDIPTFSMCLESDEFNECPIITTHLSAAQKRKWHSIMLDPAEVLCLAEKMNVIQDQPYGGIPTIGYLKLNMLAEKCGTTVLLEGQGLDESLAGYRYYLKEHERDHNKINNNDTFNNYIAIDYSQDMTPLIDRTVLSQEFVKGFESSDLKTYLETPFESHLLNAQYRDMVYTKLPRVLRFNDHVTMALGRELRQPFLDHRIVEFCFWAPAEFKIHGNNQKVLLREAMKPYIPDVIGSNHKKSFGTVQTEWFRKYFKNDILELIDSPRFKSMKYWDHTALNDKTIRFLNGNGDNSFFLWQCFNLELWFRTYINT